MIHPSDRETDRRTDGPAIAYSALSIMLMCAKNWKGKYTNKMQVKKQTTQNSAKQI